MLHHLLLRHLGEQVLIQDLLDPEIPGPHHEPIEPLHDNLMRVSDIAVSASVNGIALCPSGSGLFFALNCCTVLYSTDFPYELPI